MLSTLQYISQGDTIKEQLNNIHRVLDHGYDWVQLRFKNGTTEDLFTLAESAKLLCDAYCATFIINDHVQLAREIDADGVHLGLADMNITEAREILNAEKIIGGTANTFSEVEQRIAENCNYIGLGPFRFTPTKEKLSPVLGLEGYTDIIKKLKKNKIKIPVYAIGGIEVEDIKPLLKTGIHGIAVSKLLTNPSKETLIQLNEKLYAKS
ncbi:thiamine phosphate synthase [Flavobacterium sp. H122]|uniref:thiamine phosphate synthase n=1 Tax=Flavobacterium sp. H122 TaxID=2529860 RepID=UPI0010AAAF66|nr:thiamine phosphate synthase [Flavobacterium sp. H122]